MLCENKTTCRQVATKEEYIKYFIALQEEIGRTTYIDEVDVVYPQGGREAHYVCFYEEEPYCVFSLVTYKDVKTMSLGSFICTQKYRGKGVSFIHLQNVYDKYRAEGYSLILTTSTYGALFTKKFDVKLFGYCDFMSVEGNELSKLARSCENVVDAKSVCLKSLLEYDREVAGFDRSISLELLIKSKISKSVVYIEDGKIKGYAALMTGDHNDKIGPLCADNDDICKELIGGLFNGWQRSLSVVIPAPRTAEQDHCEFFTSLGFKREPLDLFLYGHKPYSNDFARTYGVFCLQFGI